MAIVVEDVTLAEFKVGVGVVHQFKVDGAMEHSLLVNFNEIAEIHGDFLRITGILWTGKGEGAKIPPLREIVNGRGQVS